MAKRFGEKCSCLGIRRHRCNHIVQVPEEISRHFLPIHYDRTPVVRVEELSHHICVRAAAVQKGGHEDRGVIRQQHIPVPIEDECRIGFLMLEDELNRTANRCQLGCTQPGLGILRRIMAYPGPGERTPGLECYNRLQRRYAYGPTPGCLARSPLLLSVLLSHLFRPARRSALSVEEGQHSPGQRRGHEDLVVRQVGQDRQPVL